jgi:uncharacterized membrane protein
MNPVSIDHQLRETEAAAQVSGVPARSRRIALGVSGILVLLCGVTLLAGFLNKDRCTGPVFDDRGRTIGFDVRGYRDVCYSDIQMLWLGRDIDHHVFPYVHGGISPTGQLEGGSIEYPVLTGVLAWAGAIFAGNDHQFLLASALLLAPFGLVTAWMLGRLSRWRALLWAIGPPLVLYGFHNWDLAVVTCAVAAVYVVHRGWGRLGADRPLRQRATMAAVLLGIGFALKLYPAMFALPLALYVFTGGRDGREGPRRDTGGALQVGAVTLGTAALVNLPFLLFGYRGWWASFVFQKGRPVDSTTNSIWYWGFRPISESGNHGFQDAVTVLSPVLVLASFALAAWLGWRRYLREGTYPWLGVCAAMLCGFLLLYKVHSPQYTLWIVPMFVLLKVRPGWIAAYLLADVAIGIGIFRLYYHVEQHLTYSIYDGFSAQAVMIGVWGRAALLLGLFFAFLHARATVGEEPAQGVPDVVRSGTGSATG